ncbi:MAG: hypothetical protein LPK25_02950 [Cyclobacteriaceae bacterium]|mgnify:FL=1|nr:hypothetical protein [Cyclobacteriaceae bacterium]MDX5465749.1 hypothetical protein [Cyclobacteriaceae bacterium]
MGNFLDDIFKKVFKSATKPEVNFRENYTYKDGDWEEVEKWLETHEAKDLFDRIYRNYHLKRTQILELPEVHVFSSPYANGFAVSYDPPFEMKSFLNLFLAFSRRILDLGYRQVSLDRKFEEINDQVRLTEKFYFKPPLQNLEEDGLISQLFGNITLEKISVNNQPSYIKLLATVYSDRLYQNADSFDDLMDRLFETK